MVCALFPTAFLRLFMSAELNQLYDKLTATPIEKLANTGYLLYFNPVNVNAYNFQLADDKQAVGIWYSNEAYGLHITFQGHKIYGHDITVFGLSPTKRVFYRLVKDKLFEMARVSIEKAVA